MANRFSPVGASNIKAAIAAFNRYFQALDREVVTKTVNQAAGKPAMMSGRLPYGKFGDLYYDADGVARILITAQSPEDNEPVIAISKPGIDVIKALEGEDED
jgi:hypothetical protein